VLRLSAWGERAGCKRTATGLDCLSIGWGRLRERWIPCDIIKKTAQTRAEGHRLLPYHPIPSRLWKKLTQAAGIKEQLNWGCAGETMLSAWQEELTLGAYQVKKGPFKEEFVTCGGVNLDQVNSQNHGVPSRTRAISGREVLDIDGLTGGFNFQSAWMTGGCWDQPRPKMVMRHERAIIPEIYTIIFLELEG
jgi:hypothetical protein